MNNIFQSRKLQLSDEFGVNAASPVAATLHQSQHNNLSNPLNGLTRLALYFISQFRPERWRLQSAHSNQSIPQSHIQSVSAYQFLSKSYDDSKC